MLAARARWDLAGGAAGVAAFGLAAWAAGLSAAIVTSGAAMALLGVFVAAGFPEDDFTPHRGHRWAASLLALRRGADLARRDREVLLVLGATVAVNGAGMIGWLFTRRLVELGLPGDPAVSYAAAGILSSVAGVIALRLVETRIEEPGAARRAYALGCLAGAAGLVMLAVAPDVFIGGIGLLLASGVGDSVTRAVSVIWVNWRVTSGIRATVHSLLSQAETAGEIVGGFALLATAQAAGMSAAFVASSALIACVGALMAIPRVVSVLLALTSPPQT